MMKKFLLASCVLCSSSAFSASCTFNLQFNEQWTNFKNWTIIFTDVSGVDIPEVVGGRLLQYITTFPKDGKLNITINNCTKSTQIGLFAHPPGQKPSANDSSDSASTADSNLNVQAYAPLAFLEGMAKCVGDIAPDPANWDAIPLTVGSVDDPGNFAFTAKPKSKETNSWTKAQLGVTCLNPESNSDPEVNPE